MIKILKHMPAANGFNLNVTGEEPFIVYKYSSEDGLYVLHSVYDSETDYVSSENIEPEDIYRPEYIAVPLRSTGAKVATISGKYVNVEGSSKDPKIDGNSWVELLRQNSCNCDVCCTDGKVYADKNFYKTLTDEVYINEFECLGDIVGGHIVPLGNRQKAQKGDRVLLAPICSAHNTYQLNGFSYNGKEYTASVGGTGLGFYMKFTNVRGLKLIEYLSAEDVSRAIMDEENITMNQ